MSIQEKKVITNIISTIIIFVVFMIVVLNKYNAQTLDVSEKLVFWAKSTLIFIPVSIAARIVILILFNIGDNIASEIKGEKQEPDIMDERDKLIDLRTTRISMIVFSLGFIIALAVLAMGMDVTVFFILMLVFGFVSDILSESVKMVYYQRGI